MIVRVRSSLGLLKIRVVDVDPSVLSVKKELLESQGLPIEQQILIHNNSPMENSQSLASYGIKNGDIIELDGRVEKEEITKSSIGSGGDFVAAGTKLVRIIPSGDYPVPGHENNSRELPGSENKEEKVNAPEINPPKIQTQEDAAINEKSSPQELEPPFQGDYDYASDQGDIRSPIAAKKMVLMDDMDDNMDAYEPRGDVRWQMLGNEFTEFAGDDDLRNLMQFTSASSAGVWRPNHYQHQQAQQGIDPSVMQALREAGLSEAEIFDQHMHLYQQQQAERNAVRPPITSHDTADLADRIVGARTDVSEAQPYAGRSQQPRFPIFGDDDNYDDGNDSINGNDAGTRPTAAGRQASKTSGPLSTSVARRRDRIGISSDNKAIDQTQHKAMQDKKYSEFDMYGDDADNADLLLRAASQSQTNRGTQKKVSGKVKTPGKVVKPVGLTGSRSRAAPEGVESLSIRGVGSKPTASSKTNMASEMRHERGGSSDKGIRSQDESGTIAWLRQTGPSSGSSSSSAYSYVAQPPTRPSPSHRPLRRVDDSKNSSNNNNNSSRMRKEDSDDLYSLRQPPALDRPSSSPAHVDTADSVSNSESAMNGTGEDEDLDDDMLLAMRLSMADSKPVKDQRTSVKASSSGTRRPQQPQQQQQMHRQRQQDIPSSEGSLLSRDRRPYFASGKDLKEILALEKKLERSHHVPKADAARDPQDDLNRVNTEINDEEDVEDESKQSTIEESLANAARMRQEEEDEIAAQILAITQAEEEQEEQLRRLRRPPPPPHRVINLVDDEEDENEVDEDLARAIQESLRLNKR